MSKNSAGFTLIELLIGVAIVGVLASIAYPGYARHMKKVYRAEIVGLLSEQAHYLERYHTRNGTFIEATGVIDGNDRYRITAALSPQDFTLIATPLEGAAMEGDRCGGFSLTGTGVRSNPGASPNMTLQACWGQ
ncbi:type IV pilin protein [Pseudomonas sp. SDO528_S397]